MARIVLSGFLLLVVAGIGSPMGAGSVRATIGVEKSSVGEILVSAGSRALYRTSAEQRDVVKCTGACAKTWPPLVIAAHAKPVAGRGVNASLLGTVKRPDGRMQVTYRGFPLYRFSGDTKAGELNWQGIGGSWHVIAPSGLPVTKAVPASSSSASTGGQSTSPGISTTTTPASTTGGASANPAMWCAANPKSCVNGVPVTG